MVAAHSGHPEHEAQGAPERQIIRGDYGWELEIHAIPMPATVGQPLHLALWLRKDGVVFLDMIEVAIVVVNLDEAQTVVETSTLARQGSTSQRLQLFDGVPHTIAVTVRPVGEEASGWTLPTVGLSVDVLAGNSPLVAQLRMMALGLSALLVGMAVGFCMSQMYYRGVVER